MMKAPMTSSSCDHVDNDDDVYSNVQDQNIQVYVNVTRPDAPYDPLIPSTHPVPINELGHHVALHHGDNNKQFNQQYQELYKGDDKGVVIGFSEQNVPFNRFKNITPYDDNIIVLETHLHVTNCQREYVNASYIDGYSSPKKFIACQAPLKKTLVDFWRLIWQEKLEIIVMVTNLKEGTKNKCEQYWPNNHMEPEHFGPFTVTLLDEQVLPDFVIRHISVKFEDISDTVRNITQYHLTSWPDHGVPDYATPLMILHKQVMNRWSSLPRGPPILVHCSAGVGRTGTFIAIDLALEQAKKENVVDIAGIVNRLRQQRMKMVQTLDQYVFIHDAVLESVICGETEIPSDKFQSITMKDGDKFKSQFHLLSQVTPDPNDVDCTTAKGNSRENRSNKYLPPDKFLVSLKKSREYINASYMNGYREKRTFIIAQSPMENTVRNFWKMIMDHKVSAIVMLCELIEDEKESCYQYWVPDNPVIFGEYVIETVSEKRQDGYIERTFQILSEKDDSLRNVVQFQITDWPQDGIVREPRTVLQVIDDVIHRQQQVGGGPIVVHCSDTVSRTGVYCSASIALEQCKIEGVVDVFQVTKAVKRSKPGAITSLEQYISIHEVIEKYLAINSTYGNFNLL
jgi:protein tyrosine phosphatase